jgi:hypothetical protein
MLYELNCTCGRPIEFMEYNCHKGIAPMVKVGCPDCGIMFFLLEQDVKVDEMPHMNQLDWLMLMKRGKFCNKGVCKANETSKLQLALL